MIPAGFVPDPRVFEQFLSRWSLVFVVDEALADEVFAEVGERVRDVRDFLKLELLNEMVEVADAVPWVARRGQLDQSAAE